MGENKNMKINIKTILIILAILGTVTLGYMFYQIVFKSADWFLNRDNTPYLLGEIRHKNINLPLKKTTVSPVEPLKATVALTKDEQYWQDRRLAQDYVKNALEEAGLAKEWVFVDKMIDCESKWSIWLYNINTNGTTDMGIWMINSIHKEKVDVKCRYDVACSTKWAIEKRLHDGNWSAWVCSRLVK